GASTSHLIVAVLFVGGLGLCAGAVYVLGFSILQANVEDELRGRTFATLYTLIRFCLLLAFTVAPVLSTVLDGLSNRIIGGTAVGERIRAVLLDPAVTALDARAEALLMAAARAQHVAEVIRPALGAGRHVVTDRFSGSSLAYQGFGRGLPVDEVRRVSDWAT